MRKGRRNLWSVIALLLVVMIVAAACGDDEATTTTAAQTTTSAAGTTTTGAETTTTTAATTTTGSAEPSVLIIGTNNNPVGFDASGAATTLDWSILGNVNSSLYRMDGGDAVPEMATGLPEISEDGLTYTITLRDDINFADGLHLDAALYVQQFQRTLDFGQLGAEIRVLPFVESVEATGEYTVDFHLKAVNAVMLAWMTNPEYGVAHPDQFPADAVALLPEAPIYGTGPYFISSYDLTEGRIILEPNPEYFGEPPVWDQVIWKIFEDPQTMALSLQNGEIDVAWKTLNEEQLASLREDPNVAVAAFSEGLHYFIVNHRMAPSDDPNVNQAVAAIIDRDQVLDRALGGVGHSTAFSPIPYNIFGTLDTFQTMFEPPNVELATELLAASGYSTDNPVHIVVGYSSSQWGPTYRDVVDTIAEQLTATGLFDVELKDEEWATYLDGILAGDTYNYSFLDKSPVSDPAQVTGLFVNSTGVGTYLTDDANAPLFDAARTIQDHITAAQGILDQAEREAAYHEICTEWAEIVVTIPLFLKENQLAYRSDRVVGDPQFARPAGLGISLNDVFYYDRVLPVG